MLFSSGCHPPIQRLDRTHARAATAHCMPPNHRAAPAAPHILDLSDRGPSLDAGKRLPDVEAERSVKRERSVVVGGLHQPHASGLTLLSSVHHHLHELAPDAEVLCAWIDSNR